MSWFNFIYVANVTENFAFLDERLEILSNKCRQLLKGRGFSNEDIEIEPYLHLRYEGTDCALMCQSCKGEGGLPLNGNFESKFLLR